MMAPLSPAIIRQDCRGTAQLLSWPAEVVGERGLTASANSNSRLSSAPIHNTAYAINILIQGNAVD
ncbi:hypothetical protein PAMP_024602 [Pampus punctatissimus]